jgi:hypothetical protein
VLLLVVIGAAWGLQTYYSLPVMPVRSGESVDPALTGVRTGNLHYELEGLAAAGNIHRKMNEKQLVKAIFDRLGTRPVVGTPATVNPFTGEEVRFERSPGDFSLRTVGDDVFLCIYDAECREYRVKLPPKPATDNATQPE